MNASVWLGGGLRDHVRGRRFVDLLNAKPVDQGEPEPGVCLFFGGEFQKLAKNPQSEWLEWSQEPGRVFLLVPPFQIGSITTLLDWEILSVGTVQDSLAPALARLLASEVRFQLKGTFQVPARPSGSWDNGVINTCFYRRHPHAGLFAATCLPLWSLALLDARAELTAWVDELFELAGKPLDRVNEAASSFDISPGHFTLMLHLCSQEFSSEEEALNSLLKSDYLYMPAPIASKLMTELATQGLARDGRLTKIGRKVLSESPYEPFAAELEERTR